MTENRAADGGATLKSLIESRDRDGLHDMISELSSTETARSILRLGDTDRTTVLELLEPEEAAEVIDDLPDAYAAEIMEDLAPSQAAAILDELRSDEAADLLGDLDEEDSDAILDEMDAPAAENIRELMSYEPETAGGLMVTEHL